MPSYRAPTLALTLIVCLVSVAQSQSPFYRGPSVLPLPPAPPTAHRWQPHAGYAPAYPRDAFARPYPAAAPQGGQYAAAPAWSAPYAGPTQMHPTQMHAAQMYPASTQTLMNAPPAYGPPMHNASAHATGDVPLAGPRNPADVFSPYGPQSPFGPSSPQSSYAPNSSVMTHNRYSAALGGGSPGPAPHSAHASGGPMGGVPCNGPGCGPAMGAYGMDGYGPGPGPGFAGFGACGPVGCVAPSPWFGSASTLFMTRDNENKYFFSYDDANEARQLTNARDVNFDIAGGIDLRLGRYFNCGQDAIEGVYWGLYPDGQQAVTPGHYAAGSLNGILNWDQLSYGDDGNGGYRTADEFVNNANAHLLRRDSEVHNVELNWLHFSGFDCHGKGCHPARLRHHWLLGVRFFKFHDHLTFGAEEAGGNGSFRHEDDEIYYDINLDNNLIGVQVGGVGEYCVNCRWTVDYSVKFGLFANHISHQSAIGGNQGAAWINNGPNYGIDFVVDNSKTDVSFLGEFNIGATRYFGKCWSATFGYRAVAVTGIAHPTDQIYHDLRGIQDVYWIDSNGSLILHGGYAGIEYRR